MILSLIAAFSVAGAAGTAIGFALGATYGYRKGSQVGWRTACDLTKAVAAEQSRKEDLQALADVLPAALTPSGVQAPLAGFSFAAEGLDALGSDPFHDVTMPAQGEAVARTVARNLRRTS